MASSNVRSEAGRESQKGGESISNHNQIRNEQKVRKENEMRECPKCGAETTEARSYVGGHGDVLFEQCTGLACDWFEPMESLTRGVKSLLRQQFEDQQGCRVWDVTSMVRLDDRWERAKGIVKSKHQVAQVDQDHWLVSSQSRLDLTFKVSLNGGKGCDCEDYSKRAPWGWCKHRLAAWICSQLTEAQLKNIRKGNGNARS